MRSADRLAGSHHEVVNRRSLGGAVALVTVIALAALLADTSPTRSYSSIEALVSDLSRHGVGCPRVYPSRNPLQDGEAAGCVIGSGFVTIHVLHDPSVIDRLDEPTPRNGVSWARGPNWLVATMDRTAAARVALALNADLIPSSWPAADGMYLPVA
jgi:hypothetical protein